MNTLTNRVRAGGPAPIAIPTRRVHPEQIEFAGSEPTDVETTEQCESDVTWVAYLLIAAFIALAAFAAGVAYGRFFH